MNIYPLHLDLLSIISTSIKLPHCSIAMRMFCHYLCITVPCWFCLMWAYSSVIVINLAGL